ncbi:MAG: aminoacyl-tRNA hydrolase [Buchnera aphidicola (Schlechtendalia peitan)]
MYFKNTLLIVGLANPILKYNKTRHNVGAWCIQYLSDYYNVHLKKNTKFLGYTGSFFQFNIKVHLFIPNVFMNVCGQSILIISNFYQIKTNEILIIHDELDINPGLIKLKCGCGHNGHNGVRNIINVLTKDNNFLRIQIGIGRPKVPMKISDFVLSSPMVHEMFLIKKSILNAVNVINILLKEKNILVAQKFLNK